MDATLITNIHEVKANEIKNDYRLNSDNEGNKGSKEVLSSLKKGQLVTGTIVDVDDKVTIAINGRTVTAKKNIFGNVMPGDVKTFEVVKASDRVIELRLYEKNEAGKRSFSASIECYPNWDIVMPQKEQAAKKVIREGEYKELAVKLADIAARLTEQDISILEKEGFPVCELTVSGLYEALNRIKATEGVKEAFDAKKGNEVSANKAATFNKSGIFDKSNRLNNVSRESNKHIADKVNREDILSREKTKAAEGRRTDNKTALTNKTDSDIKESKKNTVYNNEWEILQDKAEIEEKLREMNIPATAENIAKLLKALSLSKAVTALDDKAMKYLIKNDVEPTIENIYKAQYSGSSKSRPLSDMQWEELVKQAAQIIKEAGFMITEENLRTAKWLVDNQLPLTGETFSYRKELEDIKLNLDYEQLISKITDAMRAGIDPDKVRLSSGKDYTPDRLVEDIACIKEEAITQAVKSDEELTISRLVKIQHSLNTNPDRKQIPEQSGREPNPEAMISKAEHNKKSNKAEASKKTEISNKADNKANKVGMAEVNAAEHEYKNITTEIIDENQYKEIKAKRQLEEIRLKMTLDTAAALQKKGIKVETLELTRVVEALRELENSYYVRLFKEIDAPATETDINLLRETTNSVEQLKTVPAYVLGSTLASRFIKTIPQLIEEGIKLTPAFEKAGAAYEALMTVPNREYGDSIQKAFGSISSLLDELGMENTEQNQRAVRILAYNSMEINEDSIRQVKAYDLQVNELIKNLHPAVTVRMIKEGINPLDMPVYRLNKEIDKLKKEQGISDEEKYSSFLHKLEKADGISEAERKAYIGIYRLLYNVAKSDGAAIGSVLKTGREVTLDNLLTAVATSRKGRVDAKVNDEFGILQDIQRNREAISSQLSLFKDDEERQGRQSAEQELSATGQANPSDLHGQVNTVEFQGQVNPADEQTDYYNRIIKQLKDELTPEIIERRLQEARSYIKQGTRQADSLLQNTTFEHADDASDEIWELIKDIPIEKLYERQLNDQPAETVADEAYRETVSQIRLLCKNAEQAIRFIKDYNIPGTPVNLIMAGQLLSNKESPFKRLVKLQQEKKDLKLDKSIKEIKNLSDKIVDKQTMTEAYAELEDSVQQTIEAVCAGEETDSITIDRYISLQQQLSFLTRLASKEFYQIPVMTDRGITNVNLTIIRKAQSFGELAVMTSSDKLGNIKAELALKADKVTGYISCDRQEGLDKLKGYSTELERAAEECSLHMDKLDYVLIKRDAAVFSNRIGANEDQTDKNPDTERILYSLAKSLLRVVSLADSDETMA